MPCFTRAIKAASCFECPLFFCHLLPLTRLDKSKVALFVLLYQPGSSWPLVFNTHYSGTRCPFASGTTFKLTRSPWRMGGWIGGRQNLWLIASLMWQGPAVWGNWSALRVDTFCVSLSCRLLLAWPWGPRGRAVYIADTTWSAPTFLLGLLIGPGCPAVANLLVNISLKCPCLHFVSLVSACCQLRHLFQAIPFCSVPLQSNTRPLFIKQLVLETSFNQYSSPLPLAAWN